MLEIADKLLLFLSCSIIYMQMLDDPYALVPMTIVISISCLCTYFEDRKINLLTGALYAVLCFFFPNLLLYLPVILYDLFYTKDWAYCAVYLIPITIHITKYDDSILFFVGLFMLLSFFAKYKTSKVKKLTEEYHSYRDNAKELEILLEDKNHKILENQLFSYYQTYLNI